LPYSNASSGLIEAIAVKAAPCIAYDSLFYNSLNKFKLAGSFNLPNAVMADARTRLFSSASASSVNIGFAALTISSFVKGKPLIDLISVKENGRSGSSPAGPTFARHSFL